MEYIAVDFFNSKEGIIIMLFQVAFLMLFL